MFARLQGSPLEVLCDVMCDVRAEVTQAGKRKEAGRQADEASQKRVKSTDICRTLLPRAEVQGLYICQRKCELVLYDAECLLVHVLSLCFADDCPPCNLCVSLFLPAL